MNNLEREYLERRRQQCLARAASTSDPSIARLHRQFATEYERKLNPGPADRLHVVAG